MGNIPHNVVMVTVRFFQWVDVTRERCCCSQMFFPFSSEGLGHAGLLAVHGDSTRRPRRHGKDRNNQGPECPTGQVHLRVQLRTRNGLPHHGRYLQGLGCLWCATTLTFAIFLALFLYSPVILWSFIFLPTCSPCLSPLPCLITPASPCDMCIEFPAPLIFGHFQFCKIGQCPHCRFGVDCGMSTGHLCTVWGQLTGHHTCFGVPQESWLHL